MNERLRKRIDVLFQDAPNTKKTIEVKEEILQNLTEKYNDLISEGKSEDAAYNIAVASIGDVSELVVELKGSMIPKPTASKEDQKRSALLTAVAVMLYILSIIPVLLFQEEIGIILMFTFIAVATGMIIFNQMTKPGHAKNDDTIAEEFKEWREQSSSKGQVFKSISAALWSLTTVTYFLVSFGTHAWHITWVIFLIAGAINSIMKAFFDLKK